MKHQPTPEQKERAEQRRQALRGLSKKVAAQQLPESIATDGSIAVEVAA